MRIGELSRRTGVSPELLRMWERRYGLLQPERTPGGFRVYSADDERRVGEMSAHLAAGFPAAAAARLVLGEAGAPVGGALQQMSDQLRDAIDAYDEIGANAILDRALERFTIETVLASLVMPFLRDLGLRWEAGEVSIAQEHFATSLVRGRLLGLARNWGTGPGPRVVLACPPGELHDLGLICFGLALRERGWAITLLGANTPIVTLAEAAHALAPALVVLAAMDDAGLRAHEQEIAALARRLPVALAGPGATTELARAAGALPLVDPPVAAAARVADAFDVADDEDQPAQASKRRRSPRARRAISPRSSESKRSSVR